jgi:hypothetical protein
VHVQGQHALLHRPHQGLAHDAETQVGRGHLQRGLEGVAAAGNEQVLTPETHVLRHVVAGRAAQRVDEIEGLGRELVAAELLLHLRVASHRADARGQVEAAVRRGLRAGHAFTGAHDGQGDEAVDAPVALARHRGEPRLQGRQHVPVGDAEQVMAGSGDPKRRHVRSTTREALLPPKPK